MVRRRGLDQGGPGRRAGGRRVDDRRATPRSTSRHSDIARFYPHQTHARAHPRAHHRVVHQDLRHRPPRASSTSPTATSGSRRCTESQKELGAVFFETAGWERPHWYESQRRPAREVRRRRDAARARVGLALVEPDHQRRAPRACASAPACIDLTAFSIFDIDGPGALDSVQRTCVAQCDVAVGQGRSTRRCSTPSGGFRSDLTVMRLGEDHFRVVTGGAHGMADRKWFADHARRRRHARRPDRRASRRSACGVRGPATSSPRSPTTTSRDDGLRDSLSCREIDGSAWLGGARLAHLLRRRARLGALRADRAAPRRCGTRCSTPATPHGAVPVGIGVYGTTGRIEKGYRAYGAELDAERIDRRGRHAAAQGQGRRLRRQGGLPGRSARTRPRPCCAR